MYELELEPLTLRKIHLTSMVEEIKSHLENQTRDLGQDLMGQEEVFNTIIFILHIVQSLDSALSLFNSKL